MVGDGMSVQIATVAFEPQGMVVQYIDTDEVRLKGQVVMSRQLAIGATDEYREEIGEIREAVERLLADALSDWEDAEPGDRGPTDPDDDEDEFIGMGGV